MINYITLGTKDIEASAQFYEKLLEDFGAKRLVNMDRIKYIGKNMKEPMVAVCIPYDEQDPHPGNGNMFAIAPDQGLVHSLLHVIQSSDSPKNVKKILFIHKCSFSIVPKGEKVCSF